jgi:rod shape-determining protein MreD
MTAVRVSLVIVLALILQTSLVSDLRLLGATGDIMLLLAIAAGMASGPERGAIVGFASGLAFDLLLQTPFGLSALTYCIIGYVVGTMQTSVLRLTWWIPVGLAVAASAAGIVLYSVVGEVVGLDGLLDSHLVAIVFVVALLNALLSLPAVRLLRWSMQDDLRGRMVRS